MVSFLILILICQVDTTVDLSTPSNTLDTYYRGLMTNNLWLTNQATGLLGVGSYQPDTSVIRDYNILLLDTIQSEEPFMLVGDVKAIVEVKFSGIPQPPMKIRHVLRKFKDEWYSVSHSYIPDENYPDLDPDVEPGAEIPWEYESEEYPWNKHKE